MPSPSAFGRLFVATAAALAISSSAASASPYAKGPDPTPEVIAQPNGPYPVSLTKVADSASPAFGEASIYAPLEQPAGTTFGVVAVSPGFLATQTTLTWLARRLATHGFVTVVFTPNSVFDQPPARSRALTAALDYVETKSPVKALTDPTREAAVGHSMGGGGALELARRDLTLKAAVAIAPWSQWKSFDAVRSPALVIGFGPDNIAPIARHAVPFYDSLVPSLPKAYLEMNYDHAAPSLSPVGDVSRSTINWLKRFVDDDERYTEVLCPAVAGVDAAKVTGYRNTCGAGPLAG